MSENKQEQKKQRPAQKQAQQPGSESKMTPQPVSEKADRAGSGKLEGKVALITGGDRALGARLLSPLRRKVQMSRSLSWTSKKMLKTRLARSNRKAGKCVLIPGDIGDEDHCRKPWPVLYASLAGWMCW